MLPDDRQARLDALPAAIEPLYHEGADRRTILLYKGPAEWRSNALTRALESVLVYLDLLPRPHLYVEARVSAAEAFGDWFSDRHTVHLPKMATVPPVPDGPLPAVAQGEGGISQIGPPTGFGVGTRRKIARVEFALLNYPNIYGGVVRFRDGATAAGRLHLEGGGWRFTIDPVVDSGAVWQRLQNDGGVAITHAGRLERDDNRMFASAPALDVLECLHYFLWFTHGSSCAPVLPVGITRSDVRAWAQWNGLWVDSHRGAYSWIDNVHGGAQLAELFPLFLTLWQDVTYNGALRIALRYYLDANEPNPIQRGIAVAQLCLEGLAYAHLVTAGHDPRAVGKSVRANVTLRRLFQLLCIPCSIPRSMVALQNARPQTWKKDPWDGPSAVTWLRNEVIHGRTSIPEPSWRAWIQGWKLSCWYVEMCLLSLCRYRGDYRSRIHRESSGSVKPVPWAK